MGKYNSISHLLIPNTMGPNDGKSFHTFTVIAWPLESSPLANRGFFIQGKTLTITRERERTFH